MSLIEADLNQMPTGATVRDRDRDTWTKGDNGLWSIFGAGSSYRDKTAHYVVEYEGPITHVDAREEESDESPVGHRSEPYSLSEQPLDRATLRAETLHAQTAWLDEGHDPDVFDKGIQNGWFTDKFFSDLASGEAF